MARQEHDLKTELQGSLWFAYCDECQRDSNGNQNRTAAMREFFAEFPECDRPGSTDPEVLLMERMPY